MPPQTPITTVTLNTALDRVLKVENFAVGQHVRAEELSRFPAGKGINLSRGLAALGRNSIATGFTGAAEASQFEHLLRDAGPGRAVSQLLSVRGQTRENITLLDPINHTDTHVRTAGYELTRQDVQRIVSKVGLLARKDTMLVFAGSLPPGMNPADLDTLIYVTLGRGAKVILDVSGKLLAACTSVDLSVVGEPEPTPTPDSAKRLWLVKPNRQELADALGVETLESERQLLEAGMRLTTRVRWVVLTLGAEGAILFGAEGIWRGRCDVEPDQIVSTVGCGDTLLAGVLDAQAAGLEPEAVLRHGIAAATANALRSGVAEFDRKLVSEMEDRTHVQAIDPAQINGNTQS